jgi:hypothetical protein
LCGAAIGRGDRWPIHRTSTQAGGSSMTRSYRRRVPGTFEPHPSEQHSGRLGPDSRVDGNVSSNAVWGQVGTGGPVVLRQFPTWPVTAHGQVSVGDAERDPDTSGVDVKVVDTQPHVEREPDAGRVDEPSADPQSRTERQPGSSSIDEPSGYVQSHAQRQPDAGRIADQVSPHGSPRRHLRGGVFDQSSRPACLAGRHPVVAELRHPTRSSAGARS